jgi:hypothetical protein
MERWKRPSTARITMDALSLGTTRRRAARWEGAARILYRVGGGIRSWSPALRWAPLAYIGFQT